jgi:hypothetical protein
LTLRGHVFQCRPDPPCRPRGQLQIALDAAEGPAVDGRCARTEHAAVGTTYATPSGLRNVVALAVDDNTV